MKSSSKYWSQQNIYLFFISSIFLHLEGVAQTCPQPACTTKINKEIKNILPYHNLFLELFNKIQKLQKKIACTTLWGDREVLGWKKGPKGINYFVNHFINGHLILEIIITYDIS